MQIGICGSVESNDCLITVKKSNNTTIKLESIVKDYYGQHIEELILQTLKDHNILNVEVSCIDKGALDYTIVARLLTAIERMRKKGA